MTWYLKYRPQKVGELDLVAVREHLSQVLAKKDLPHAWLFAGPRGTGKTSAARILAKAVNCTGSLLVRSEPCNECEMCVAITVGSALDVVEIDAASNRGIDEIRDLRDKIKLAPLTAKFKVYIIDEVHMLTPEAFNALLKTLEEPPQHVVFILCTTEIEKLPPTVISRCTVVKFGRPTVAEVVAKLERVAEGEELRIKNEELRMIAQAAKDSFRDAIKILEQVALSGQSVDQVLGLQASADPAEFVRLVQAGQTKPALEVIAQLVDGGGSIRGFIERCVDQLREQLLAGQPVLDLIAAFEQAYVRAKESAVAQLPLEILVIGSSKEEHPRGGVAPAAHPGGETSGGKLADVQAKWSDILKAVRPKNHSVEALLRSTRPIDWDGSQLTLEVFYKFHKDKLETDKCRRIVEEAMAAVLGSDAIKLDLRLGQKQPKEEISAQNIEEDLVAAAAEIFKVEAI